MQMSTVLTLLVLSPEFFNKGSIILFVSDELVCNWNNDFSILFSVRQRQRKRRLGVIDALQGQRQEEVEM